MKKAQIVLAGTVACVLALSGCSHSPSTAVTVNGTSIPVADVDAEAKALVAATPPEQGATTGQFTSSIVTYDTLGLIADKIAADQHITVTADDRAAIIDNDSKKLAEDPALKPLIERMATAKIVYNKLGADKFSESCANVDVKLNPRYGTWSKELCNVLPSNGLSQAAPQTADQTQR